jgi:hypothetical protein
MLVLSDEMHELTDVLHKLVMDYRKVHISRYPVNVSVVNNNFVAFVDGRFPVPSTVGLNDRNSLGSVYLTDNDVWVVSSRLIQNEKYSLHNTDYRTKKSKDLRKIFKYMKEYLKPYSALEIANRSMREAKSAYDDYKQEKVWKVRDYALNQQNFYEELLHMQTVGYVPKTEGLRKALTEGLPVMQEAKEIEKKDFTKLHVYLAPDGMVTVSVLAKYVNMEMGTTTFESLESAPTLIQQHVGMLKMMDKDTHVPNVGYKSSDTEFWIEGIS